MTAEIIQSGFDYSLLSVADRSEVERDTQDIRKRGQRMANDIVAIGKAARRVKERLDHGMFTQWAEAEFKEEFGWSYQTLSRFMQVSDHFQNSQIEKFGKSALYLLSQNSTPEEAREEAKERAEAGETITHAVAKEIVDQHSTDHHRALQLKRLARDAGYKLVGQAGSRALMKIGEYELQISNGKDLNIHSHLSLDEAERMLRELGVVVEPEPEPAEALDFASLLDVANIAGYKLVQAGSIYDLRIGLQKWNCRSLVEVRDTLKRYGVGLPESKSAEPAEPAAEPEPMPNDLRSELSRLGWELQGSRLSPHAGTLYKLACDGGRGATEERGREGWEQMRDDLLADEQMTIKRKIRSLIPIHPDAAYKMLPGITNQGQREKLMAEIDAAIDAQKPAITTPDDFHEIQQLHKGIATIVIESDGYHVRLASGKIQRLTDWDWLKAWLGALQNSIEDAQKPADDQGRGRWNLPLGWHFDAQVKYRATSDAGHCTNVYPSADGVIEEAWAIVDAKQAKVELLPSAWRWAERDDGLCQAVSIAGIMTNAYITQQDVIDEVWELCNYIYDHTQTDMTVDLLHVASRGNWEWRRAIQKDGEWIHTFSHSSNEAFPIENNLKAWIGTFRGVGGFAVEPPATLYHLPKDFAEVQQRLGATGHLSMDARTGVFRLALEGEESTYMHDCWGDVKARIDSNNVELLPSVWQWTDTDLEQCKAIALILSSMTDVQRELIAIALGATREILFDVVYSRLSALDTQDYKRLKALLKGDGEDE